MRFIKLNFLPLLLLAVTWISCSNHNDEDLEPGETLTELPAAFAAFDKDNTTIMLDGSEIVIETNGLPNHTSPYWSSTNARNINGHITPAAATNHPLFVEPTVTSFDQMAPGNIDDFNGSYTLRVPAIPTKASSTSSTGLGAIGISVSGAVIYNDKEGPNVPLDGAIGSLDYNGAHTGPQSYHYHLEPIAFSDDDDNLIGIISDGFLFYGRKCTATNSYPVDLDASGGHASTTKYNTEVEYH
jgi:hypothetical protein